MGLLVQRVIKALQDHKLVKLDILGANVILAKVVTTKLEMNVKLAIVIAMDDQAIHVALMEHVLVKLDILEANVSPANVITTTWEMEPVIVSLEVIGNECQACKLG